MPTPLSSRSQKSGNGMGRMSVVSHLERLKVRQVDTESWAGGRVTVEVKRRRRWDDRGGGQTAQYGAPLRFHARQGLPPDTEILQRWETIWVWTFFISDLHFWVTVSHVTCVAALLCWSFWMSLQHTGPYWWGIKGFKRKLLGPAIAKAENHWSSILGCRQLTFVQQKPMMWKGKVWCKGGFLC